MTGKAATPLFRIQRVSRDGFRAAAFFAQSPSWRAPKGPITMRLQSRLLIATSNFFLALPLLTTSALAAESVRIQKQTQLQSADPSATPAPPPGPIGVFGLDIPAPGKLALSITPNFANFAGMKMGTRTVSNQYIVTTVPYFLDPRRTVRVVPQNIAFQSQNVVLNYGVSKGFAVIANAGIAEKSLEALVFKGASGITPLTRNYSSTTGLIDFSLSGVYKIYQDEMNRVQLSAGFTFPTGFNTATFSNWMTPLGQNISPRAFYGMQLGTHTFDFMPGIVYLGYCSDWSWGASYRGRFPLANNPQGYRWGNLHEFNSWLGYTLISGFTSTFRLQASMQGAIRGRDPEIKEAAAPANPLFYGGQRIELFGGSTISGKFIGYDNWTLGIEAGLPVYQNLNGPQIMKNWQTGVQLKVKI